MTPDTLSPSAQRLVAALAEHDPFTADEAVLDALGPDEWDPGALIAAQDEIPSEQMIARAAAGGRRDGGEGL